MTLTRNGLSTSLFEHTFKWLKNWFLPKHWVIKITFHIWSLFFAFDIQMYIVKSRYIWPSEGTCTKNFNLLQKILTSSSINLRFRFSVQACWVHKYHKMHHPWQFGDDRTRIDWVVPSKGTSSKNLLNYLLQRLKHMAQILWLWNLAQCHCTSFIR